MTKILIDRSTVEQVLEALYEETAWFGPTPKGAAAITALKAALAEPVQEPDSPERRCGGPGCDMRCCQPVQEPVAWLLTGGTDVYLASEFSPGLEHEWEWTPLYAHPPQRPAEPVQEPAFHGFMSADGTRVDLCFTPGAPRADGTYATAYYTAPPQRKPLTEEEISEIASRLEQQGNTMRQFARAVERAHGIDGAPEERNFCSRCGKRTNGIHTCTPPAPLTDEVIADLWHQNGGFHHHFARAIERWLRGHA